MTANFDRLARPYLALERIAFGRDLERARFRHIDALKPHGRILVLGEGDGRFLSRLLRDAPVARIDCVDASPAMLSLARSRLSNEDRSRVDFHCEDVMSSRWKDGTYDAVATLFFLDCFTPAELAALIPKIGRALKSRATWVWADFNMPEKGWRRWRAAIWTGLLYRSFRWLTGLGAGALPPADAMIESHGFRRTEFRTLQAGMIASAVFTREEDGRSDQHLVKIPS